MSVEHKTAYDPDKYVDPDLRVFEAPADTGYTFTCEPFSGKITCDQDSEIYAYGVRDREYGAMAFVVLRLNDRNIAFNARGGERLSTEFKSRKGFTKNSLVHVLDSIGHTIHGRTISINQDQKIGIEVRKFDGFKSKEEQDLFLSLAVSVLHVYDFGRSGRGFVTFFDRIGVFISENLQKKLDSGEFIND